MTAALAPEYTYIAVLGVIFGAIMALGIGANDVANAFGSSVSAGSLSLGWAIILGSIFEFLGSILLGAKVAGTIRGKVLKTSYYKSEPALFMFGDLTALIIGSTWLFIATALELPVSTTHTIVAGIIGFGLAAYGFQSVDWWNVKDIFISWGAAPIFSGILSSIFFKLLLETVLKSEHIFERALNVYPIVVFCALGINLFFILFKANNNIHIEDYGHRVVLPVSLGGAAFCALVTHFVIVPMIRNKVNQEHDEHVARAEAEKTKDIEAEGTDAKPFEGENNDSEEVDAAENKEKNVPALVKDDVAAPSAEEPKEYSGAMGAWNYFADNTFRQDLKTQSLHESKRAADIWDVATEFDPKTERLFSYLQVFTACLASFAHGANDVANAIAPMAGILDIYKTGKLNSKAPVPKWILAVGGACIALGFTFYGYKIIKAVGFKLTCISPARGFCIELAASLSVVTASYIKLPVSTTQCLVGATCGVGLASGGPKNVQWLFLLRVCCGWAGIFLIACIVNAGFFAFCVYSPSL